MSSLALRIHRRRRVARLAEARVVPMRRRRRGPDGLPRATGILHDDPHAAFAIVVRQIAERPDTRMPHLDDGGHALAGADPEDGDARGRRNAVAIERDDLE